VRLKANIRESKQSSASRGSKGMRRGRKKKRRREKKEKKKKRSPCLVRRRLYAKFKGPPQAKPAEGAAIFCGR
jgi:hypothetical protein